MRPLFVLPFVLVPMFVGCAAASEDETDDAAGAVAGESTPPRRETPFAEGDVDLTTYKGAGETEWADFRKFYETRHPRENQQDHYAQLEQRTREKATPEQLTKLTSFVAMKGYTTQTFWFFDPDPKVEGEPVIPQDYSLINTALRNIAKDPSSADAKRQLEEVKGYIKSAASGVNMMPEFRGTLHRRVFFSDCPSASACAKLAPYQLDKEHPDAPRFVREPSFVSSSEVEKVTCFFRGQAHFIYEANGKAHSVKSLSDFEFEKEAIFPPGTIFRVTSVEENKPIDCKGEAWDGDSRNPRPPEPKTETIFHLTAVE
jgi:hypothetical protein